MLTRLPILALLLAGLFFTACNQNMVDKVTPTFEPTATVLESFEAYYPQARDVSWSMSGEYHYAQFAVDARRMGALFAPAGDLFIERADVPTDQLPVMAQEYLAKYFKNYKINTVIKVTNFTIGKGQVSFETQISNDRKEVKVVFDSDGNYESHASEYSHGGGSCG